MTCFIHLGSLNENMSYIFLRGCPAESHLRTGFCPDSRQQTDTGVLSAAQTLDQEASFPKCSRVISLSPFSTAL